VDLDSPLTRNIYFLEGAFIIEERELYSLSIGNLQFSRLLIYLFVGVTNNSADSEIKEIFRTSCNIVFSFIFKNSTFQATIVSLCSKADATFKDNFSVDFPF